MKRFWQDFINEYPKYQSVDRPEAWQFGVNPDELANLVISGVKTATSSGYRLYEIDNEDIPQVGELNMILDSHNNPVCITQTLKVKIVPFNEVTADFAYLEGEGDRTLSYWRREHEAVFVPEYQSYGLTFQ